jgi:carboxyl-terminal processing protease
LATLARDRLFWLRLWFQFETNRTNPMTCFRLFLFFVALLGVSGCASPGGSLVSKAAASPALSEAHQAENLQLFDLVWRTIAENHFDRDFHGVDWNAVREELRPQAARAADQEELRATLQAMLARLGQSHMSILPGPAARLLDSSEPEDAPEKGGRRSASGDRSGDPGLEMRWVDGALLVTRMHAGEALGAPIKPGWIIEKIGHEEVAALAKELPDGSGPREQEFIMARLAQAQLSGPVGSSVQVLFRDAQDRPVELSLPRSRPGGEAVRFGFFPPFYSRLESRLLQGPGGSTAGFMHFNIWMIPAAAAFDKAMDEFREAHGMIIDLRGNIGGLAAMAMGMAGHFIDERLSLGTMKLRESELRFNINPRRVNTAGEPVQPFEGPLAILIDPLSLSASELFAGGMQDLGRARIFGETSGGQALPATWERLPNGDLLYYPFADFILPGGTRLEGRGVVPDVVIPLRRADLLEGRDRTLDAALQWISEERLK